MSTCFKLMSILLGLLFPFFLVKAVRGEEGGAVSRYTLLACLSFGGIVFTVMGLLPD